MAWSRWGITGLSLLLCLMVACGNRPRAPVEDRYGRTGSTQRSYLVQKGDTLYSIAFRYGLDYRRVAAANGISQPYTIYPGQRITLREAALPPSAPVVSSGATRSGGGPTQSAARPGASVTKDSSSSGTTTRSSASTAYAGQSVSNWRWPARGRVLRGFSSSVHKGIDIDGKRGDPVLAVAAGKVVYAGTGIVGFGELLIIKHNDVYLSAYGHNDRLLVAEGDVVGSGQKVALMGSTGTDRVKLHLEIRREGKPVDPMKLLPRR